MVNIIETPKPKESERALEDEFKNLHLKLPVLKVIAHAPMYNAILDKFVESLELGKNRYAFIQGEMLKKMKDPGLFTLPCRLGDSKTFNTLANLGFCVKLISLYLFKTLIVGILEETENVVGLANETRSYHVGIVKNLELNETTVGCTRDILRQRDCLDRFSKVSWIIPTLMVTERKILYEFPRFLDAFVTKITTGRMIDGLPCGGIDMVIKDLDLEPKIDVMMRDFLDAWRHNDCATNLRCKKFPFTMRFEFVTNSRINYIQSIDSRSGHFDLYATIMTGDDCVSMVFDTHDVEIWNVQCGPGHGFSIGSLGKYNIEEPVRGITIRDSSLRETQNGLRIKTWAPSPPILALDIIFHNIVMDNVDNPIFIDQQYCPHNQCYYGAQSNVQIRNVTFSEVHGTSSSRFAVKLQCSKNVPCEDIKLININLAYHGPDGPIASSCVNVEGKSYGVQRPSGCL
nr:exopolygalacturonase-like [Tanacetum cinerariifolium]